MQEYGFKEYIPKRIKRGHLKLGGVNPGGERIDVNSLYIERGGRPVIDVMGKYHFSRDHAENWYGELCKMRAGGVTLRSSCVSILVHKGVDVKTIQKWVGHADINTTLKIYAKVKDKEAKKQASESMDDLILPEDDE